MARLILVDDNLELASLIASTARARGHLVKEVHSGQAALAALVAGTYDVGVVDLLLPDVRGSDILAELKQRAVPTFVMSGVYKGPKFEEQARRLYGVRGYFEKPFELDTLLDAIEEIVGPGEEEEELEVLEPLETLDDEPLGEESVVYAAPPPVPVKPPSLSEEPTSKQPIPERVRAASVPPEAPTSEQPIPEALRAASVPPAPPPPPPEDDEEDAPAPVSEAEAPSPAPASAAAPPPEAEARFPVPTSDAENVQTHQPFARRGQVWDQAREAGPAGIETRGHGDVTQGDLRTRSVPRLLNAYYQAKHQGELKLKQGKVQKVVFFEQGQPIYAASNLAGERFGRFCLKRGVMDEAAVAKVAALSKAEGKKTGEVMLELGLLTPEQRASLLEEQVKEIIWSTFGWTEGEYTFSRKQPRSAELVRLKVFTGDLILEGVLRKETLVSLRSKLPGARRLFPTADPPYGLEEIALSGPQALLLAYADGSKTVEDLITLTDLSERDALATLHGLELMGLLEERREDGKQRRISFGL